MTPGRFSRRSEFTPVPSHGSTFVYMIPPQNVMPAQVTLDCDHVLSLYPGVSSPQLLYRGENFTPVRNLAAVSCKREPTTRFGVKSVRR